MAILNTRVQHYTDLTSESEIKYDWIKDQDRQMYAGMISKMDEAIGDLVEMLQAKGKVFNSCFQSILYFKFRHDVARRSLSVF